MRFPNLRKRGLWASKPKWTTNYYAKPGLLDCQSGVWSKQLAITTQTYGVVKPAGGGSFNGGTYQSSVILGSHKYCALGYSYSANTNGQNDCGVAIVGSSWLLYASTSTLGGYASCAANCFD